jgi:hypothetical protein
LSCTSCLAQPPYLSLPVRIPRSLFKTMADSLHESLQRTLPESYPSMLPYALPKSLPESYPSVLPRILPERLLELYPYTYPIRLTRPYPITYLTKLPYPIFSRPGFSLPNCTQPPNPTSLPGRVTLHCTLLLTHLTQLPYPAGYPSTGLTQNLCPLASHLVLGLFWPITQQDILGNPKRTQTTLKQLE